MKDFLLILLVWYGAFATVLVAGLAILARMDRALMQQLHDRIAELEEELHLWREEAAELEDEEKCERFDRALHRLVGEHEEKVARRIVAAIETAVRPCGTAFPLFDLKAVVLRELHAAWDPEPETAELTARTVGDLAGERDE